MTTSIMCNDLGLMPIVIGGNEDQKKRWLGACTSDFKLVSFCLSEPEAGSDVAGMQLPRRARRRSLRAERHQVLDHERR
jgi:acyl-CoA dehydrogenase